MSTILGAAAQRIRPTKDNKNPGNRNGTTVVASINAVTCKPERAQVATQNRVLETMVHVLTGMQQQQQQTGPQTVSSATASNMEERKKKLKEVWRKCESVIAQKLPTFSEDKPSVWMSSMQNKIPMVRFEWLEDEVVTEPGIARDMKENLAAAVISLVHTSLPTEAKSRLGMEEQNLTVAQVL